MIVLELRAGALVTMATAGVAVELSSSSEDDTKSMTIGYEFLLLAVLELCDELAPIFLMTPLARARRRERDDGAILSKTSSSLSE